MVGTQRSLVAAAKAGADGVHFHKELSADQRLPHVAAGLFLERWNGPEAAPLYAGQARYFFQVARIFYAPGEYLRYA
ncbi:hypothetical protein HIM_06666 [Hirsutella minnesotensis 3608]|uniref:Uncharacterized protein n=1 Tax=Hirsutella minnesotensis 3608 TaxID=1043627 RepID=A0A0F7ZU00_9HYPO|nr:hypothetical protein HIM_06666 [Hirsutella minnesotensis 3608]